MRLLSIGERERRLIAKAKERAARQPIPLRAIKDAGFVEQGKRQQMLADRPPGFDRSDLPPTYSVMIPFGFRAAYSIEEQPSGLCAHLSIGLEDRKGKSMMPSVEAVRMIAKEFGITFPGDMIWTEEYEPGEFAVNIVAVIEPRKTGNA